MRRLWHWITRPWRSPPPPEPSGHDDRIRQSQQRQDAQARRLLRYLDTERERMNPEDPR